MKLFLNNRIFAGLRTVASDTVGLSAVQTLVKSVISVIQRQATTTTPGIVRTYNSSTGEATGSLPDTGGLFDDCVRLTDVSDTAPTHTPETHSGALGGRGESRQTPFPDVPVPPAERTTRTPGDFRFHNGLPDGYDAFESEGRVYVITSDHEISVEAPLTEVKR